MRLISRPVIGKIGKNLPWVIGLFVCSPRAVGAASASEQIGAERCGSCHAAQYAQWRTTGHAEALVRLSEVQAKDPVCRSCHTMDPKSSDPALAGVQCESCHGSGRFYAPEHVMKDPELRRLLGLTAVEQGVCLNCHTADSPGMTPFDFAKMVLRVRHGTDDKEGGAEPKAGEKIRKEDPSRDQDSNSRHEPRTPVEKGPGARRNDGRESGA